MALACWSDVRGRTAGEFPAAGEMSSPGNIGTLRCGRAVHGRDQGATRREKAVVESVLGQWTDAAVVTRLTDHGMAGEASNDAGTAALGQVEELSQRTRPCFAPRKPGDTAPEKFCDFSRKV